MGIIFFWKDLDEIYQTKSWHYVILYHFDFTFFEILEEKGNANANE
jgi:hypothetical protein